MDKKIVWISEEEMQNKLNNKIKEWKPNFSKDGYIVAGEGEFEYKGIFYLIKVLRYYNHTNRFTSMSSRISDKHVVVEYPEKTKSLKALISSIEEDSDFLYHDTLHSWNDNMTIEEQIDECHKMAHEDIDKVKSNYFIDLIQEKILSLENLKVELIKIKELIKKVECE